MAIDNGNRTTSYGVGSTGSAGQAGSAAGEFGQGGDFGELLGDPLGSLGQIGDKVIGFIRERPGTSLLIALGAGFLIGRLIRD